MTEQELKKYLDGFKNELLELIEKQLAKPEKQLLTIREAADYLSVSHNNFKKFHYEGLKFFEIDGTKRVYKHELDLFIKKIVIQSKDNNKMLIYKVIKYYKTKNSETRYMIKVYLGIDPVTGHCRVKVHRVFKYTRVAKGNMSD